LKIKNDEPKMYERIKQYVNWPQLIQETKKLLPVIVNYSANTPNSANFLLTVLLKYYNL
jgi:hypothetical protein